MQIFTTPISHIGCVAVPVPVAVKMLPLRFHCDYRTGNPDSTLPLPVWRRDEDGRLGQSGGIVGKQPPAVPGRLVAMGPMAM